jgi:hypothetical protein
MPKASKPKKLNPYTIARESKLQDTLIWKDIYPWEHWCDIVDRFKYDKETLRRRAKGRKSVFSLGGYNARLKKEQEQGLIQIIDRYTFISTPLRLDLITQVTNCILRDSTKLRNSL